MVKHIVLWKIKDGEDKQQNMTRMAEMLTDLVGKIDGLEGVEMGYNFNTNSDYDIVLYATLRNTASLRYYQNHPLHVACKDFIGTIAVDRTAVDYFYEEGSALTLPSDAVVNDPYMPSQTEQAPFTLPELSKNDEQSHFTEQVQEEAPLLSQEEQPKLNFDTPITTNEKVIFPDLSTAPEQPYHEQASFSDEPPTLESYNLHNEGNGEPNEQFSYIKNDTTMEQNMASAEAVPAAPSMPFGQNQVYTQSEVPPYGQPVMQNVAFGAPISEPQPMRFADLPQEESPKSLNFSDIPQEEPKPMRFSDMPQEEPKPMRFSDLPQEEPKPMRFSDLPQEEPKPMRFSDLPQEEPKPMNFSDLPPAAPMRFSDEAAAAPTAPVQEKRSIFAKKEKEPSVSPITQATESGIVPDNYWKCPNCGKIMPKYVGTCGCGEVQPFEDPQFDTQDVEKMNTAPTPSAAPVTPAAQTAPIQEKRSIFAKKEKEPSVSPITQATESGIVPDNYWKCPNCGKIMPKYVGTCGCGEVQPFEDPTFDTPTTPKAEPVSAPAAPVAPTTPTAPVQEKRSIFAKKEKEPSVSPITQATESGVVPDNCWKCPNCGKIMPKYVGTCGCGEVQPFEDPTFDTPATPKAEPVSAPAAPVAPTTPTTPVQEKRSIFAKKEKEPSVSPITQATESGIVPDNHWKCPNCGKIMPKYVGTCGCGEVQPFEDPTFDTLAAPKAEPVSAPAAPVAPTTPTAPVQEKRSIFAKKEKEPSVSPITQAAESGVVPDNHWKCPNCGKIMPKYVGTCGCGEPQPYEDFAEVEDEEENTPASNAWKCLKCSALNSIFQRRCTSCGRLRPEE